MGDDEQQSQPESEPVEDEVTKKKRAAAVSRPYPRRTIEEALKIPKALKEHNGGNPWAPGEVAKALAMGASTAFFYLSASSRDYGFTEGTRDASVISLTPFGKQAVYPDSPENELLALRKAFLSIGVFKRVVDFYHGSKLPEKQFLANALETTFALDPRTHDEFVEIFSANCRFLSIGDDFDSNNLAASRLVRPAGATHEAAPSGETVVVAPRDSDGRTCFVIMPFVERTDTYSTGFFDEVFNSLFKQAAVNAGFIVKTAKRQGSDVIQSTIVTELLQADLVLADLTEHNPNVLFELGMRMARDLPVALVRAKGTGAIFDVDNVLRVQEYSPNLWPSTVEKDVPRLTEHIIATWENQGTMPTYMKLLDRG
jgi:hypothetical protein